MLIRLSRHNHNNRFGNLLSRLPVDMRIYQFGYRGYGYNDFSVHEVIAVTVIVLHCPIGLLRLWLKSAKAFGYGIRLRL